MPRIDAEDLNLIQLTLQQNDGFAFERLVKKYQSPLRLFLRRLLKSQSLADDLAQETLIKAFKYLATYQASGPFLNWLFKIGHQIFLAEIRKNRIQLESADLDLYPSPTQPSPNSPLTLEYALTQLRPEERAAIVLHYQMGLTQDEIAQTLECPLGSVKSLIRRGRQKIKQCL